MASENATIQALLGTVEHVGVLQKLATAVPYLSEAEQTLVNFILHHPMDVTRMSAAELASATGVSPATLFRLCRELDFSGYTMLREQVREAVERLGESFVRPTRATDVGSTPEEALDLSVYTGIRALLDACSIDRHDVEQAARLIGQAARIHICGLGPISARLAEMTAFSFQRLGLTCVLWTDRQTLNEEYARFNEHDVVLALSHSGENAEIAKFLQLANEQSAATLAIVNYGRSTIARQAQIPLVTQTREGEVQNFELLPRLPQMMLVQVLVNLVRLEVGTEEEER